MNKILYPDDLVLVSESMENLTERFLKLKGRLESKGLKVNLNKTKVMVSGSKEGILKRKVNTCVVNVGITTIRVPNLLMRSYLCLRALQSVALPALCKQLACCSNHGCSAMTVR